MTLNKKEFLRFELLEDVMNLTPDVREKILANARLYRIGPLLELLFETSFDKLNLYKQGDNQTAKLLSKIISYKSFLDVPLRASYSAAKVEFFRCYETSEQENDARWFAFCKRLEDAARRAGLRGKFTQALAGTFTEMVANLWEHSEKVRTGLVGYRWDETEFEYVVADGGIGVLNSLKQNVQYEHLKDSGQALEVVIEDGQSKYGSGSGRGTGFHDLIYNIANRRSYLRFRSGNHCLTIDGTQNEIKRITKSCSEFDGFLISLVCKSK